MVQLQSAIGADPRMYSGNPLDFMLYFDGFHQPIIHDYPLNYLVPFVACSLYMIMVFVGPRLMEHRKPWNIPTVLRAWNLFMTVLSVLMCIGIIGPMVVLISQKYNFFLQPSLFVYDFVCNPDMEVWHGPQVFWGWIFAFSKFIELGDTFLLIVRKKELIFLHYYHHTTVLLYTWFSVGVLNPTSGFFAPVNATVHIFLYYYYFIATEGYRPWWGKFLTQAQLVQMVLGMCVSGLWGYYYFSGYACPQDHPVLLVSVTVAMYASYFLLFFIMYTKRWNAAANVAGAGSKKKTTNNNNVAKDNNKGKKDNKKDNNVAKDNNKSKKKTN